jgi:uncharacterized protein (DUF433 family)
MGHYGRPARSGGPLRFHATLAVMDALGAYTADRAAALSGVPKSTIHWWARKGILEPTVSATKVKLWSYADLMGLRVIYWRKTTDRGVDISATSMPAVRQAIGALRALDLPLWHAEGPTLFVDGSGAVYVKRPEGPQTADGQLAHEFLDLVAPFTTVEGTRGPDLVKPRPDLRIVPGKVSGSPHLAHTRIETRALAALTSDGFDVAAIHRLYPYVAREHIEQALDLETQLAENLQRAA